MESKVEAAPAPLSAPEWFTLPWDLSQWLDRKALQAAVVEIIGTLDWQHPQVVEYLRAHPEYRPRAILGLLTFAYATGVFEAEAIVTACWRDPMFRALSETGVPSPGGIGRFRKEHRGLLKWALVEAMKRALQTRFALGDRAVPTGLHRLLVQSAIARLDLARHVDRDAHGA